LASILIVYASIDGHTVDICSRIQAVLKAAGDEVTMIPVTGDMPDLNAFDKIVLGASIHYGKHSKPVYRFVERYQAILEAKPSAFFSVNVVARKPEKATPDTNPYLKKFLRQIRWKPKNLAVFAGRIDYQRYTFFDRNMIRFIMWMTKGPTDPQTNIDFTDWQQVDDFGGVIHDMQ